MKLDDVDVKDLSESDGNCFELNTQDKRTFKIHCSDQEEVKEWVNLIQRTASFGIKQHVSNSSTPVNISLNEIQTKPILSSSISDSSSSSNILRTTRETSFRHKYWTNKSLLPHPVRMNTNMNGSNSTVAKAQDVNPHNNDMMILQVIESYCQSSKSRKAANSSKSLFFVVVV
jgi:hypothetical protein